MFYSENKNVLEKLLGAIGNPTTTEGERYEMCRKVMCLFPPSLVQKVIAERKEGWFGDVGRGARTISGILQSV